MKYYNLQDALQDVEKHNIIGGDDYQKEQLLSILDSIKEKAQNGQRELVWKVKYNNGEEIDWISGMVPLYLDFIVESLVKLGFSARIEETLLYVKW